MTSSEAKQLIADNQTEKVILWLLETTERLGDKALQNEVIQQSSKYNDYLKEKAAGTKSREHLDIQMANINAALMYLVDKLPSQAYAPLAPVEALAANSVNFFLKYRHLLAGGLLLLILAVLLAKPSILGLEKNTANKPFEFTVTLIKPKLPDYPTLQGDMLEIKLDNHWTQGQVDEFGDVDFKGIPGDFIGKQVYFRLASNYWELLQDSLYFEGKSASIQVRPNGALAYVRGSVQAADGTGFLAGVELRLDNSQIIGTSNSTGYFEIAVPLEFQKEKYALAAALPGFEPQTLFAYPSEFLDIRLVKNQ